jgi:hypothetical protein
VRSATAAIEPSLFVAAQPLEGGEGAGGFNDLVIALQQHWLAIAWRFPNVEDIKTIGIDLTKRGGSAATKAIEANQEASQSTYE